MLVNHIHTKTNLTEKGSNFIPFVMCEEDSDECLSSEACYDVRREKFNICVYVFLRFLVD